MAFRDMDSGSVCFETRPNWPQRRMDLQGLPDVSLHMLPDRLPSLSEYVQDDFPSPQLKEDFDGNLIVQLDKEYCPRSSGQDVLPRSCFDVLNNQVTAATENAHSLISTSLATIGGGGFPSTWPSCIPSTSVDHFPASLGTSACRNLPQGRNSPFVPTLTDNAATFRELTTTSSSSVHLVSTQNQPFQTTTAFPLQNNFRVSPSLGSQPLPVDCDRFNEKPMLGSSGTGYYAREPWTGLQQHHQQQQQHQQQQYPGSLGTSTDRKPMVMETVASLPEPSMEHSPGSLLKDCSVTWSTGSLISSGLQGWVDNHRNSKTPPLRKRAAESTTVNMEDPDAMKLEMKRAKNREAAQRCQQRKQERIVRLEGKVGKLKEQNVALTQTVRGLREQIAWLQRQVVTHANNGCQLSVPRFFSS